MKNTSGPIVPIPHDRSATRNILLLAAILLLFSRVTNAEHQFVGKRVPFFSVTSGEGRVLDGEMVKGKVVIIFYETRDAARKNSAAKDHLNGLYENQPEDVRRLIVRLPVFNLSRYIWPFTRFLKEGLIEHSQRTGVTLYADWEGRMLKDLSLQDHESNVLLIDKNGIIQYRHAGRIGKEELERIETVLQKIVYDR